jgi:signal transduction histidine kinase
MMLIEISDNGVGMTTNEIETALRPFGQVDQGFNKKYEGTGLGLPISAALVGLHGGTADGGEREGQGHAGHGAAAEIPDRGSTVTRAPASWCRPAPANAPATNGTASLP